MKKNILYCEGNIDGTIGGSYFSLFFLVDGLDKTKYEPTVVFHTENSLIPMYREAGIHTLVFDLPKPVTLVSSSDGALSFLSKPLSILQKIINFSRGFIFQSFKYRAYLKKHKIDLLHLNNSVVRNHPWMFGAMLSNVKCITHERGINPSFPAFARFFGKRLNAVICISKSVKDNMVDKGYDANKLFVIHNGVNPDRVIVSTPPKEVREKYQIEDDAPVIGIAGNIRSWKGQDVIVKATAQLIKKLPNLRCFIIGDATPEDVSFEKSLHKLVDDFGLRENIIFTGYRKNVPDYFNAMDVVLHSSVLPEPFGRVLIEAMALKKPLIGARDGAVPEIIEHGVTGMMCEPGNVEEYVQSIEYLLTDKDRAHEMGVKGYERLQMEFHVDRNVEKTENLYQQLFNE